jgi:hypothetical protein
MEVFKVPSKIDDDFAAQFFYFISLKVEELASETGKWPDQIQFLGKIGDSLFNLIEEKGWNFSRFNPQSDRNSILNKIIIQYTKPLSQISDTGVIRSESLNGKEIKGIPGEDTFSRILSNSISLNFKSEKTVRPKLEIKLVMSLN